MTKEEKHKYSTKDNIFKIVLYSLTLTVALGVNELMLTLFYSKKNMYNILSKIIYILALFSITIIIGYTYKISFDY